ncbi:MAG: glycosyltransferase family 2 protein [Methanomassiliicoccales archaeon]
MPRKDGPFTFNHGHVSKVWDVMLHNKFYIIYALIFSALEISLGLFVINWGHLPSVFLFVVLSVLFLGSSYGLAREVIALLSPYRPPNKIKTVPAGRKVALIYTTMNDVVPECLQAIRQTYPCDVFVLDDSSNEASRKTVDSISAKMGFTVVRRNSRRGFKAGAINDWLRAYPGYDYIVLLDADSYIPQDWVEETLKYAEHPDFKDVAVFQGMINIWNLDTNFVRTLASMSRVGQFVWEQQLANKLDAVFCYGHNAMIRVEALKENRGFVEGYVSEDFATSVALAEKGWKTRFVPLHTYEAMPENIRGFIRRQNKWTKGSMEFFGFCRSRISRKKKVHLIQIPLGHITNLLLPVGMLLTVYGFSSTPSMAASFLKHLLANPLSTYWSVAIFRFMTVVGVLTAALSTAVRMACGIRYVDAFRHKWLSASIRAVSIPYEFRSILAYFSGRIKNIPVTPKNEAPLSGRDVLRISSWSIVIELLLITGLIRQNPLGALYNAIWLVPMAISPLIIMKFSGISSYTNSAAIGNHHALSPTSLFPDPVVVNTLLHDTAGSTSVLETAD